MSAKLRIWYRRKYHRRRRTSSTDGGELAYKFTEADARPSPSRPPRHVPFRSVRRSRAFHRPSAFGVCKASAIGAPSQALIRSRSVRMTCIPLEWIALTSAFASVVKNRTADVRPQPIGFGAALAVLAPCKYRQKQLAGHSYSVFMGNGLRLDRVITNGTRRRVQG